MPTNVEVNQTNEYTEYVYTQGEREGKVQGSATYRQYVSLEAAKASGVDCLEMVNAKLKAIAVNSAAGISNSDGVRTLKQINGEIEKIALGIASGEVPVAEGQVTLRALIKEKADRKK